MPLTACAPCAARPRSAACSSNAAAPAGPPATFDQNTTAAFSPDGTTLAIDASFGHGTCLYNATTRDQGATATLPYPAGQFHFAAGLALSPDGGMLAVDDTDPSHVYLWNVNRNRN